MTTGERTVWGWYGKDFIITRENAKGQAIRQMVLSQAEATKLAAYLAPVLPTAGGAAS